MSTRPWLAGFRDKIVLVTGASSGIGRATALAFASAGARVVLVARRRAALEEVAALVAAQGPPALVVPTDVSRQAEVRDCFRRTHEAHGRIDVVVSNAGILQAGKVIDLDPTVLDAMLRVNLFGSLFVLQEAVRAMRRQPEGGSIVSVASLAGRRGISPMGGYCATKFALVGLIEALRMELHGERVHVSLVLPGIVDTPMGEQVVHDPDFLDLWPEALNMPPSWVVWAVLAAARFHLVEISVPPGLATLEKLAALTPGMADRLVHWARATSHWLSTRRTAPSTTSAAAATASSPGIGERFARKE